MANQIVILIIQIKYSINISINNTNGNNDTSLHVLSYNFLRVLLTLFLQKEFHYTRQ